MDSLWYVLGAYVVVLTEKSAFTHIERRHVRTKRLLNWINTCLVYVDAKIKKGNLSPLQAQCVVTKIANITKLFQLVKTVQYTNVDLTLAQIAELDMYIEEDSEISPTDMLSDTDDDDDDDADDDDDDDTRVNRSCDEDDDDDNDSDISPMDLFLLVGPSE